MYGAADSAGLNCVHKLFPNIHLHGIPYNFSRDDMQPGRPFATQVL